MAMRRSATATKVAYWELLILLELLRICGSNETLSRRSDFSNPLAAAFYLPPDLPEVLDARFRKTTNGDLTQPSQELQVPPANSHVYSALSFARSVDEKRTPLATINDPSANVLDGQITISDMSCQNNGDDLHFRASLSLLREFDEPIIEKSGGSCKLLKIGGKEYRVELSKEEFWNCGVIDCSTEESGKFYCLSLRFPAISGLRLKDDFQVTLQCRAQEKIASHTRRMGFKTIDTAARMAPRIAVGGRGGSIESDVGLYRSSLAAEQAFDSRIEPGGTLVLGEQLLLRAIVRDGDGWQYSRMSEVTVQFAERRRKSLSSLWILDKEGCPNPRLRHICPGQQYQAAPLVSQLPLKAFAFENMRESDEMLLSVKVTGCLEPADCLVRCSDGNERTRRVRDTAGSYRANATAQWRNDITFRVVAASANSSDGSLLRDRSLITIFMGLVAVAIVMAGLIFFITNLTKNRRLLSL